MHSVSEFADVPLRSITQSSLSISEGSDQSKPEDEAGGADAEQASPQSGGSAADFDELLSWLGETLSAEVTQVRLSSRLTTSPSCLVTDEYDPTPSQEKNYRAGGNDLPAIRRILELNPDHQLVTELQTAHASGIQPQQDDPISLTDLAHLLMGMTLLAEGGEVSDSTRFVNTLAIYRSQTVNHRG